MLRNMCSFLPPSSSIYLVTWQPRGFDDSNRLYSSSPMDSPLLSQLFRQLFRHPACQSLRSSSPLPSRRTEWVRFGHSRQQCRPFLSRRTAAKRKKGDSELHWVRRDDYPQDIEHGLMTYPVVTAKELRRRRERPRQVQMLTREFIDGMRRLSRRPSEL